MFQDPTKLLLFTAVGAFLASPCLIVQALQEVDISSTGSQSTNDRSDGSLKTAASERIFGFGLNNGYGYNGYNGYGYRPYYNRYYGGNNGYLNGAYGGGYGGAGYGGYGCNGYNCFGNSFGNGFGYGGQYPGQYPGFGGFGGTEVGYGASPGFGYPGFGRINSEQYRNNQQSIRLQEKRSHSEREEGETEIRP